MATDVADWTQAVNVTGGSVSISGTANVSIVGTPAVTISGTATVQISGTPSVTIASGTVNIGGTPVINVQQANGVNVVGPNLLPRAMQGPITAGWVIGSNLTSLVFNADGTMTGTATLAADAIITAPTSLTGTYAMVAVHPGETYQLSAAFKTLDHANTVTVAVNMYDAAGGAATFAVIGSATGTLNTFVVISGNVTIPAGKYFLQMQLFTQSSGTGSAGDRCIIDRGLVQNVGAFAVNAQQGALPVSLPWVARGTYTTVGAGAESFTTATLSPGDQTLGIAIEGSGVGLVSIKVVGVQSATQYVLQGPLTGAFIKGWKTFSVNPALDTTYTISWQSSSGVGLVVAAFSSAHTLGYPNLGQTAMNESIPVVLANDQTTVVIQAAPSVGTAFASASRGVGTSTATIPLAPGAKGVVVYVNLTAGAGNVTVTVSDSDPISGATVALLTSAALAGVALTRLIVSPDLAAVANLVAQSVIGSQVSIQVVVAGAPLTFSVAYGYLL